MKTNDYLYGEGVEVPELPRDVVMRRIELLRDHLGELLNENYMRRDTVKIRAINKAIAFWAELDEA